MVWHLDGKQKNIPLVGACILSYHKAKDRCQMECQFDGRKMRVFLYEAISFLCGRGSGVIR